MKYYFFNDQGYFQAGQSLVPVELKGVVLSYLLRRACNNYQSLIHFIKAGVSMYCNFDEVIDRRDTGSLKGFVRMNLGCPRSVVEEVLHKLERAVNCYCR